MGYQDTCVTLLKDFLPFHELKVDIEREAVSPLRCALGQALSAAKGLARRTERCFAALILRCTQDDSKDTAPVGSKGTTYLQMSKSKEAICRRL